MEHLGPHISRFGLENHGLDGVSVAHWNYSTGELYEHAIRRGEGHVVHLGPLAVGTGAHTGRAAQDKFLVDEPSCHDRVWWGEVNRPFDPRAFDRLRERLKDHLQGTEVFIQDCYAGADAAHRLRVRVITEKAWHSLFARNMFIVPWVGDLDGFEPDFTIVHCPTFQAEPERDGTRSGAFILANFGQRLILIGGTLYAGEIKKSIFTVMNYLLPQKGVLAMHCSANVGPAGDTALFFGLSGTGKTTLSADPDRTLIGDDEHGWSDEGIFNFEGGCYAKVIRLSKTAEPEIFDTTRRFGTILENVVFDPKTRHLDLDDASITENTRAAYPISHIPNASLRGTADHPKNILMLTADAFGVLPPISKLTPEQAMYHFISGYTAKLAGTEAGVGSEPIATFSACFGAPFMALHPSVYADLLGQKVARHGVDCWLINTGWSGGPYGVGQRIAIGHTRGMVHAALDGSLRDVPTRQDPIFGLHVPTNCPGVPNQVLDPRSTWSDKEAYDQKARDLAHRFRNNFEPYADAVDTAVLDAGPRVG